MSESKGRFENFGNHPLFAHLDANIDRAASAKLSKLSLSNVEQTFSDFLFNRCICFLIFYSVIQESARFSVIGVRLI